MIVWFCYLARRDGEAPRARFVDGPMRDPSPEDISRALVSAWRHGWDLELVNGPRMNSWQVSE